VFWDVASCSLVGIHRLFGETHFIPEHGTSYLRRLYCLWKPVFECKESNRFECRRKAKYRCIRMQHCTEIVNSVDCSSVLVVHSVVNIFEFLLVYTQRDI